MLFYITVFFILMSGGFICFILKKGRFELSLPFTCGFITAFLFLFGFFGALLPGFYILLGLCGLCLLAFLAFFITRCVKEGWNAAFHTLTETLATPAFLVFLVLYAALIYINKDRLLYAYDEFSHWGTVVREMTTYNVLGTDSAAHVWFRSYPPCMSLFQYFIERIYMLVSAPEFSEWILAFSYQIFGFSFMLPFLSEISAKKPAFYALSAAFLFVPVFVFGKYYSEIYIDPFLGIVAGSGMALLLTDKKNLKRDLYIGLCCTVLVLSKDAGMLFAVFLAAANILKTALEKNPGKRVGKVMKTAAVSAAFIAVPKLIWEMNVTLHQVKRNFSSKYDFGSLFHVLTGTEDSYRPEVLKKFLHAFTGRDTPLPILLFFGFALLLLYFMYRAKKTDYGKENRCLLLLLAVECAVYLFGLGLTYLYKFTSVEALKLADFARYTGILKNFLLFTAFLSFVQLYSIWNIPKLSFCTAAFTLFMLFGIRTDEAVSVFSRAQVTRSQEYRAYFTELTGKIMDGTEENTRIGIISSSPDTMDFLIIRYNTLPRYSASVMRTIDKDITDEEKLENLNDSYDYVAVFYMEDDLKEKCAGLFENPENIQSNSLYRVNPESGKLVLYK